MLSGKSQIAAVIGWPISHSVSPTLHGFWLDQYNIDGAVIPLAIAPADFHTCLKTMPKMGLKGCWITLPHKEKAFNLADELDEAAKQIGAVNTITFTDENKLIGSNTDGYGFLENLKTQHPNVNLNGSKCAVLGAGGAARAVIHALLEEGCSSLVLTNRTKSRAQTCKTAFEAIRGSNKTPIGIQDWIEDPNRSPDWLEDVDLLVNTTSLGMTGQPRLSFSLDKLSQKAIVYDLVYKPLMTDLLIAAKKRGNPITTGLGMLIHQGRPGFRTFFGKDPQPSNELTTFLINSINGVS